MSGQRKYSMELRERATRMALEARADPGRRGLLQKEETMKKSRLLIWAAVLVLCTACYVLLGKKSSSAENEKYIAHQLTDYINCFQAVTHYHVLYSTDKWSAIKLKLDTGRTHQIRVHMQAIGHPLLGDSIYNTSTMNREQCTIYRAALHAWKVRLRQPFNGRKIELEVPVPEDFKKYGGFYVSSGS